MTTTLSSVALVCALCTPTEVTVINELQKDGITDKNAVATILGNIKQESGFNPLACEGYYPRSANSYWDCYKNTRGGFGLIQWTSELRIRGLGTFCAKYGCNPNTTAGQMRYLLNEYDFVRVRGVFETPNLPLQRYKDASYRWLRWGITGPRWTYTHQYLKKINEVPSRVVTSEKKHSLHRETTRGGLQLG